MASIDEITKGINGDNWGTTISDVEKRNHMKYISEMDNSVYERDLEDMRALMKVPNLDRETGLSMLNKNEQAQDQKYTGFIDGFMPKNEQVRKPSEMIALNAKIDTLVKCIEKLETDLTVIKEREVEQNRRIELLELMLKEQSKGFFERLKERITNLFNKI